MPDIQIKEKLKPLDAELLQVWTLPPVPRVGNNEHKTDWCEIAADAANQCNKQIVKIKALQP